MKKLTLLFVVLSFSICMVSRAGVYYPTSLSNPHIVPLPSDASDPSVAKFVALSDDGNAYIYQVDGEELISPPTVIQNFCKFSNSKYLATQLSDGSIVSSWDIEGVHRLYSDGRLVSVADAEHKTFFKIAPLLSGGFLVAYKVVGSNHNYITYYDTNNKPIAPPVQITDGTVIDIMEIEQGRIAYLTPLALVKIDIFNSPTVPVQSYPCISNDNSQIGLFSDGSIFVGGLGQSTTIVIPPSSNSQIIPASNSSVFFKQLEDYIITSDGKNIYFYDSGLNQIRTYYYYDDTEDEEPVILPTTALACTSLNMDEGKIKMIFGTGTWSDNSYITLDLSDPDRDDTYCTPCAFGNVSTIAELSSDKIIVGEKGGMLFIGGE